MKSFYLVTSLLSRISIYRLRYTEQGMELSEKLVANCNGRNLRFACKSTIPLHSLQFGTESVAFTFGDRTGIVCGLIAICATFDEAIRCWILDDLDLNDFRWRLTTDLSRAEIRSCGMQAPTTFMKDSEHPNVLHMLRKGQSL